MEIEEAESPKKQSDYDDSDLSDSDDDDGFFMANSTEIHKDIDFQVGQVYYNYKMIEQLSKRTFVVEDLETNGTGEKPILRIYDNFNLKQNNNLGFQKVMKEVELHSSIDSLFVIKFYEYFQTSMVSGILYEKADQNLLNLLKKQEGGVFNQEKTIFFLKQILNGMADLHKNRIIHNKLQLSNILVDNEKHLKITEFSNAQELSQDKKFMTEELIDIIPESAPEIKKKQAYGIKSDIYSIGLILYQLLFGQLPFDLTGTVLSGVNQNVDHDPNSLDFNVNGIIISQDFQQLIKKMLHPIAEKRISWEELYRHPVFSQYQNQQKTTLQPSPRSCLTKLTFEQEVEKKFHEAQDFKFYQLDENSAWAQKIKKDSNTMNQISKSTKQTEFDVWNYDYSKVFNLPNQYHESPFQNEISYNNHIILQNHVNFKDSRFDIIQKFEDLELYKKQSQLVKNLYPNFKEYIPQSYNFQEKQDYQFTNSGGLCTLHDLSDFRAEKMIMWQPKELIYTLRILLSFVVKLYEKQGMFHSDLRSENIILEYNPKNSRIELKIVNLHQTTKDWSQKQKLHNYILGPKSTYHMENEKDAQVIHCSSKEERFYYEIMDVLQIILELCVKSYFNKEGFKKNESKPNLAVLFSKQEDIIKEAQKKSSQTEKFEFYLNQIRQVIYAKYLLKIHENQEQEQKQNSQNQNCKEKDEEQEDQKEQQENQQQQQKLPFQKPIVKKSQFSSSNLNEVIHSSEVDKQEMGKIKQQEKEDEEEEKEDLKKNSIVLEEGKGCDDQGEYQDQENVEKFHEQFKYIIDTIQHIIIKKLYTQNGLKDFLAKDDVFRPWEFNSIDDSDRVIEDVIKQRLGIQETQN